MIAAPRLFVTGTDTDAGKTWVAAALALALRDALPPSVPVTIVKAVQTGLAGGEEGDAAGALRLASRYAAENGAAAIACRELVRFAKAADPHSAALAEGRAAVRCRELVQEIDAIGGAVVVEGSGGAAVPLNARETLAEIAVAARLEAVTAVGLRLGCINHAILTVRYLRDLGVPVRGAVLVERWGATTGDFRSDVARALDGLFPFLTLMRYDPEAAWVIAETGKQLGAALTQPC